jgi:hypothetical protein
MKKAILVGVVVSLGLAIAVGNGSYRIDVPDAFSEGSYWNTPLPADAPLHPRSSEIVSFLATDNALDGCITLAGPDDEWGMPIYVTGERAPVYEVKSSKYTIPAEFSSLRIPPDALPAETSDSEMVVYDLAAGFVAHLSKARFDAETDTWSVTGGSIAYLDSNGLYGALPESDDPRNGGSFRGYNGAVSAVHYEDVRDGELDNVVKIGVNNSHVDAVAPMVGSDGDLDTEYAPLQGTRVRIRPDLDLTSLRLSPQALIIARGLQEYGAIIGDSTAGAIVLKLEDMDTSGAGGRWRLERESLCAISAWDLQVVMVGPR